MSHTIDDDVIITGDLTVDGRFDAAGRSHVRAYNTATQTFTAGATSVAVILDTEIYDTQNEWASNRFTNNSGYTKTYLVNFRVYPGVMASGEIIEVYMSPNISGTGISASTVHGYTEMIYYIHSFDSDNARIYMSGTIRLLDTEWFEVGLFFGGTSTHAIGDAGGRTDLQAVLDITEF
ncbi:MAG: hypothetical protein N2B06_16940 [Clostridium sp.]